MGIKRGRGRPRKYPEKDLASVALSKATDMYMSPNTIIERVELSAQFAEFVKNRKETGIDYSKELLKHEIDRWPLR